MVEPDEQVTRSVRRAEAAEKRRDRLAGAAGVLLGGVLAVLAGLASSWYQAGEARDQEDRTKKSEVYLAFLDAADNYAIATSNARDCLVELAQSTEGFVPITPECTARVNDLAPTRNAFQRARNAVFYYGSVAAEDQALVIASYLPPAVGGDPQTGLPDLTSSFAPFSYDLFGDMYADFNDIVRCEVPARPRDGC